MKKFLIALIKNKFFQFTNSKETEWILRKENWIGSYLIRKHHEAKTNSNFWEGRRSLKWILKFNFFSPPYFSWMLFFVVTPTVIYFWYWIINLFLNNNEKFGGWNELNTNKPKNRFRCKKEFEKIFVDDKQFLTIAAIIALIIRW